MNYNKEDLLERLSDAPIADGSLFYTNLEYDMMHAIDFKRRDYSFDSGASKFVIIPREGDFVIKIPFNCYQNEYWDYDEEDEFLMFEGAEAPDSPWDYCAAELYRYRQAQEVGLEQCLAKTEFLGYVNHYPIYVQEKCIPLNVKWGDIHSTYIHSVAEREKTTNACKSRSIPIDLDWLTDFRLYYGEDVLIKFIDFILNNKWNDLSAYNIGYTLDDKPVLIDFASYNE